MLMSVGALVFDLSNNVHEYRMESKEDFARKDIIGARKPHEHVGAGDDKLTLRGKLFPEKLGGAGAVDALLAIKTMAAPQLVIRGDGKIFGWYVITDANVQGQQLDGAGRPRVIDVDVTLERTGTPAPASVFAMLISLFG